MSTNEELMTLTVTRPQLITIAQLLGRTSKGRVQQNGETVIVDTTYTHTIGSQSDGDTEQVGITYEVRHDGMKRVLSECKPRRNFNQFELPGWEGRDKQWH